MWIKIGIKFLSNPVPKTSWGFAVSTRVPSKSPSHFRRVNDVIPSQFQVSIFSALLGIVLFPDFWLSETCRRIASSLGTRLYQVWSRRSIYHFRVNPRLELKFSSTQHLEFAVWTRGRGFRCTRGPRFRGFDPFVNATTVIPATSASTCMNVFLMF